MKTKSAPVKVKNPVSSNGNGAHAAKKRGKATNGHSVKEIAVARDPGDSLDFRQLLGVLTEVKNGNFEVRMPYDQTGLSGKICDTLNEIISLNEDMMLESGVRRKLTATIWINQMLCCENSTRGMEFR